MSKWFSDLYHSFFCTTQVDSQFSDTFEKLSMKHEVAYPDAWSQARLESASILRISDFWVVSPVGELLARVIESLQSHLYEIRTDPIRHKRGPRIKRSDADAGVAPPSLRSSQVAQCYVHLPPALFSQPIADPSVITWLQRPIKTPSAIFSSFLILRQLRVRARDNMRLIQKLETAKKQCFRWMQCFSIQKAVALSRAKRTDVKRFPYMVILYARCHRNGRCSF